MNKQLWQISVLALLLALVLCACGASPEKGSDETTAPIESVLEMTETELEADTEPEIELDPEWLGEQAIDEAVSYLFPLEGEINVDQAQEILLPLLESGNAEAQYYWGYIYDFLLVDNTGEGEKESLYWYELSLQQGFPKAYLAASQNTFIGSDDKKNELINLARQAGIFEKTSEELGPDGCYLIGNYHLEFGDPNSAMDWYSKSAQLGNTSGMNHLGVLYYEGEVVTQDPNMALKWLLKAAESGDVYGMHNYAAVLTDKDVALSVINQKHAEDLPKYQKAASEGDPEAMYYLYQRYSEWKGVVKHNDETAEEWLRKAADAGHADAMYILAGHSGEDELFWYLKAAEAGHPDAMYECGRYSDSPTEAAEWYHKAAEAGNRSAMYELYCIYLEGKGVEANLEISYKWADKYNEAWENLPIGGDSDMGELLRSALEWYQKAADKGHAIAMHHIGYWSVNASELYGAYGPIRYEDQASWYQKGAKSGDCTAMFELGYLYETGDNDNVPQDYDEAMKWYIKAYVNGHEPAAEKIYELLANQQGVNAYFENYREFMSTNP